MAYVPGARGTLVAAGGGGERAGCRVRETLGQGKESGDGASEPLAEAHIAHTGTVEFMGVVDGVYRRLIEPWHEQRMMRRTANVATRYLNIPNQNELEEAIHAKPRVPVIISEAARRVRLSWPTHELASTDEEAVSDEKKRVKKAGLAVEVATLRETLEELETAARGDQSRLPEASAAYLLAVERLRIMRKVTADMILRKAWREQPTVEPLE